MAAWGSEDMRSTAAEFLVAEFGRVPSPADAASIRVWMTSPCCPAARKAPSASTTSALTRRVALDIKCMMSDESGSDPPVIPTVRRASLVDEVVGKLRQTIERNGLTPGARLPSEMELTSQLKSLQPRQIIARERAALDANRFHCRHDLPQRPIRVRLKMSKLQCGDLSPLFGTRLVAVKCPGGGGHSRSAAVRLCRADQSARRWSLDVFRGAQS